MTGPGHGGGSDIRNNVGALDGAEVRVQKGDRRKARLTVCDPARGLDAPGAYTVLDVLGLLDDTTVPEMEE